MKIINELCYSQINTNKKDTLATKLSIFLAVILLGTIIFIIGSLKEEQHHEIVSTVGDYQVSLTDVNKMMMQKLLENDDIKKVSFDKFISTDLNAVIIEKGEYFKDLKGFEIVYGRNANSAKELIAPTRFFKKNKDYKIGSKLKVAGTEYTFVGEYRDYESSFEESALIGILNDESQENIFNNSDGIEVFIWYKSPRDTYKLTKNILEDFQIDYTKSLDTGRLYFNKDILEYEMIYPSGIIPPKSVMAEWVETYGVCMVLVLLFAVMIYGAFNVWNNRDIKELALLKSVGMTQKQVRSMIRLKAIKIGIFPVLAGTAVSYITANLLLYFMWLNNLISYKKMSDIFEEKMRTAKFHLVSLSFSTLFLIVVLAFITVYLSAIIPAGKSAKLNVIEGLTGIADKKIKYGKSRISGKVERTLARDYFKAYSSTYKTIIFAMLLSAMVMTLVLVSQSYRTVDEIYGKHKEQYNFQSQIFTDMQINKQLVSELYLLDEIDEIHIYEDKSFKFYLSDNKGFYSDELKNAFESGNKSAEDMYVNIIALNKQDFDKVIYINKLGKDAKYILLNKTPEKNNTPYSFRKYISLTNSDNKELVLRYNADEKKMPIHIDAYIKYFPFDLEAQNQKGIYVFTTMENLEKFIEEYGQDKADPTRYYNIKLKAKKNLDKVSDSCERIISSYIPKSDCSTSNDILRQAATEEQLRNEHILNVGIQIILIILALSNAYNSFHGNLRARKRDFKLLSTAGMTNKQIKKMIYVEFGILFRYVSICYIAVFISAILVRSYRSEYELGFICKEIIFNLNYVPIILIFGVIILGVILAIRSSTKKILNDDLNSDIKEI